MLDTIKNTITPWHLLAAGMVLVYYFIANTIFGYVSPTMVLFGLPCPGCGLTRSGLLLLTGNFAESFRMHPLLIPLLALGVWAVLCRLFWPGKFGHVKTLAILLLICFFAVYIVRMATIFPDTPPLTINRDSILHRLTQQ